LFFFGCNLLSLFLIWRILGRVAPERRLFGLVFYGWSPIVTLLGYEHLDALMVVFLLLAIDLRLQGRRWSSLASLTLSAMTKFLTLPLIAVDLLLLWRGGSPRRALLGLGLVSGLTLLLFLPFASAWESAAMLTRAPHNPSPGSLLSARGLLFTPGLVLAILWSGLRSWRSFEDALSGWAIVCLWLMV